jgi:glyoxylase-like metal-dependent hydrolase (beta-lactamase superfamily II)
MKLKGIEIKSIECERFALDGGALFGIIPKSMWQKEHPADHANRIELRTTVMLIESLNRNILIDTGIGSKYDEKLRQRFQIRKDSRGIVKGLADIGIKPAEISDVILTHLHFDHTGGTTYRENGELKITFPNATHYVQAEQWQWACSPSVKDRASFLKENFVLLEQQGCLEKLDGNLQLFPGIEIIVVHGHTPAMQLVKISDDKTTILHGADLIPTASHIPLPWNMAYDNQPLVSIREKMKLLPQLVENQWILFFEHDVSRAGGKVKQEDRGYRLEREIVL